MVTASEGVIHFDLRFSHSELPAECDVGCLQEARARLFAAGLVGRDPARYEGLGYGNLSERVGNGTRFVISGSQTGGLPRLEREHYALVTEADPERNVLWAMGACQPSSESLTHALLYQLGTGVGGVVHVHSPLLWAAAERLGLPVTPASAPYGSVAMVRSVRQLWFSGQLARGAGFVMLGHQDGVVTFGADVGQATDLLFDWLGRI